MQQIVHTEFYSLFVDTTKNRLYASMRGVWEDTSSSTEFIRNVQKAIRWLSKGFTVLTDLTRIQWMSSEWVEVLVNTQRMFIEAGFSKEAEIHPPSMALRMQIDTVSRNSGIQRQVFASRNKAENWLDGTNRSSSFFVIKMK